MKKIAAQRKEFIRHLAEMRAKARKVGISKAKMKRIKAMADHRAAAD